MRPWALLLAVVCLAGLFAVFAVLPWVLTPQHGIWGAVAVVAGFLCGLPRRQPAWATASATLVAFIFLLGMATTAYMEAAGLASVDVFGVLWAFAGCWLAYKFGLAVSRMWHRGRGPAECWST